MFVKEIKCSNLEFRYQYSNYSYYIILNSEYEKGIFGYELSHELKNFQDIKIIDNKIQFLADMNCTDYNGKWENYGINQILITIDIPSKCKIEMKKEDNCIKISMYLENDNKIIVKFEELK